MQQFCKFLLVKTVKNTIKYQYACTNIANLSHNDKVIQMEVKFEKYNIFNQ